MQLKLLYIGNLNENVTNEDIYKLLGVRTTEYTCQKSSVDLKIFEKAEKERGFGFATIPEFVSAHLIELNGVEFYGKPVLIEEARSKPTQNLKFDPRLRNTQNPQNLPPPKVLQKNPPPILPKKTPTTIIQMLLNQERKMQLPEAEELIFSSLLD